MIRIVTLDEFEVPILAALGKALYTAFAVGAEHHGQVSVPAGLAEPFDAKKLLESLPKIHTFTGDRVLFVTAKKLAARKVASGETPTAGLAHFRGQRAIVTTTVVKSLNPDNVKTVARYAMQEVGHTLGLHHCLDPRCAMYPSWTPSYPQGEANFCVFCRDTSEAALRMTKS